MTFCAVYDLICVVFFSHDVDCYVLDNQYEFEYTKGVMRIEGQTTQWPKDKVQKDKQRSTKHKYKTKD